MTNFAHRKPMMIATTFTPNAINAAVDIAIIPPRAV